MVRLRSVKEAALVWRFSFGNSCRICPWFLWFLISKPLFLLFFSFCHFYSFCLYFFSLTVKIRGEGQKRLYGIVLTRCTPKCSVENTLIYFFSCFSFSIYFFLFLFLSFAPFFFLSFFRLALLSSLFYLLLFCPIISFLLLCCPFFLFYCPSILVLLFFLCFSFTLFSFFSFTSSTFLYLLTTLSVPSFHPSILSWKEERGGKGGCSKKKSRTGKASCKLPVNGVRL